MDLKNLLGQIQPDGGNLLHGTAPFHVVVATTALWHIDPVIAGPFRTINQGIRASDNQNSLRAGARGPTLLEDFVLREKIFHFDHERIPERIVHARGSAAHGYFENYNRSPISPRPTCSSGRAKRRRCSPAFQR